MKLFLLVLALTLISCCSPAKSPSQSKLLDHIGKSAVALMNDNHAFCSGNFISNNTILTAQHCVEASRDMNLTPIPFIIESDGLDIGQTPTNPYFATILKEDKDHDLALLIVTNPPKHESLTIAKSAPEVGENIFNVSNPKSAIFSVFIGKVSNKFRKNIPSDDRKANYIQCDISCTFGSSGSSIVNSNGEIVGVVESVIQANNQILAVHLFDVKNFLK